jgi:hypothetical protein
VGAWTAGLDYRGPSPPSLPLFSAHGGLGVGNGRGSSPKSSLLPWWSSVGGEAAPTRADGLLGGSIVAWRHGELDGEPRVGFWKL